MLSTISARARSTPRLVRAFSLGWHGRDGDGRNSAPGAPEFQGVVFGLWGCVEFSLLTVLDSPFNRAPC